MVATRESLLTASAIKLYGRVIPASTIDVETARDELGSNRFLREQLERQPDEPKPVLARIYGFSYFGRYTALVTPGHFPGSRRREPASPRAPSVSQRNAERIPGPGDRPAAWRRGGNRTQISTAALQTGPNSVDFSGQA